MFINEPFAIAWRLVALLLGFSMATLNASEVFGQDYPIKPIRIVSGELGGNVDFNARLIEPALTSALGQQVIVDNRPTGIIVGDIVAKAPPDGYTLLVAGGILWIGALLQKVPYDPVIDFSPISLTTSSPTVLVVHPLVAANSVKELIALAKSKPGELNYGSAGPGSAPHLAAELFKAMAGVNIVRISYRGAGPALNDLLGGQVQLMFSPASPAMPHVKSGRLRALAVTSLQPSALLPGVPTVASSGVPGYESSTIVGILAPAKTPDAIINRLNQAIVRSLNTPDVKQKSLNAGMEVVGSTPEQFAATMKSEMARLGKVIKDTGIRAE